MHTLTRRSLLVSSAAVVVGASFGRALAQSDVQATLKMQGFWRRSRNCRL